MGNRGARSRPFVILSIDPNGILENSDKHLHRQFSSNNSSINICKRFKKFTSSLISILILDYNGGSPMVARINRGSALAFRKGVKSNVVGFDIGAKTSTDLFSEVNV